MQWTTRQAYSKSFSWCKLFPHASWNWKMRHQNIGLNFWDSLFYKRPNNGPEKILMWLPTSLDRLCCALAHMKPKSRAEYKQSKQKHNECIEMLAYHVVSTPPYSMRCFASYAELQPTCSCPCSLEQHIARPCTIQRSTSICATDANCLTASSKSSPNIRWNKFRHLRAVGVKTWVERRSITVSAWNALRGSQTLSRRCWISRGLVSPSVTSISDCVFSAQQHVACLARYVLSPVRPSVCLSVVIIIIINY